MLSEDGDKDMFIEEEILSVTMQNGAKTEQHKPNLRKETRSRSTEELKHCPYLDDRCGKKLSGHRKYE